MAVVELLIAQSDPANAALVAVVWWRLDTRLTAIRRRQEEIAA